MTDVSHLLNLQGANNLAISAVQSQIDNRIRQESFISFKFSVFSFLAFSDNECVEILTPSEFKELEHPLAHFFVHVGQAVNCT